MTKPRLSSVAALLLSACASSPAQQDLPAVLVNPTAAGRSELTRTISDALHGTSVILADDALTHDSLLIIERIRPRDEQGNQLSGRDLDKPEHFRLVKAGQRCVLVHERTGKRQTLAAVSCRFLI